MTASILPTPEYKIVQVETALGRRPACPHCDISMETPRECCAGQSYEVLRARLVKIAELMATDPEEGAKAFFALVETHR